MHHSTAYDDINEALPALAELVLDHGHENGSRNGRVMEATHVGIRLDKPWQREILLPGRKANIAAQIAESMWVLAGRNDIGFLSHYLPRAADFSDDGATWRAGYGPRLRKWDNLPRGSRTSGQAGPVDQLACVVELLRRDPLSRRAVMSIFDPTVDFAESKDIPCNNWLSFSNRLGKLDLHVAIRSNDLMWGWSGINAFEWSVLQEVVAGMLGIQIGSLHFSVTSLHLYQQHWAKARRIADEDTEVFSLNPSPRFNATGVDDTEALDHLIEQWFRVEYLIRCGAGSAAEYVDDFPEPMMQSWLRVLQWWWSGDHSYLKPLAGTALEYATHVSVQPPEREPLSVNVTSLTGSVQVTVPVPGSHEPGSEFIQYVNRTHEEKHAAYGDSWKRRGEMLAILPNIARKVDRLGAGETSDETQLDTAMDLLVYLVKYRSWMMDQTMGTHYSDDTRWARQRLLMEDSADHGPKPPAYVFEDWLREKFERLIRLVEQDKPGRADLVEKMINRSYQLACSRWDDVHNPYDPVHGPDTTTPEDAYRGADHD